MNPARIQNSKRRYTQILVAGAVVCAIVLAPTPGFITVAIAAMAFCAGSLVLGFFAWRFTRLPSLAKPVFLTAAVVISVAGSLLVFAGLRFLPALFR